MSETRRLIKNTGVLAVGGMATKIVQFLLLPLYTSVLSTGEYGTVDYINTLALFLVPAASLLMDEALFRFLIDCKTDGERRRVLSCSCVTVALGCTVLCIAAIAVWMLFRPDNLLWLVLLVLSQVLLQMTSALLRGSGKTPAYALMNFVASIVTIILNIVLIVILRWGFAGMLLASIIGQGGTALAILVGERAWSYLDPSCVSASYVRSLVRYSLPLIPNKVSWSIMNMVDRLIIMNSMGPSAAGIYAVSYKFPNAMDALYGFFYQSWRESSARALGAEGDERAFYRSVYRALGNAMMSIVLILAAAMPALYALLIDEAYREGMRYVPVLLLAMYFSNMSGFYGGIFTAHRDTAIMGKTTVVSALLCLALSLGLIPAIGLWGASVATLAATFTVNEYRRVKVRRYVELDEDPRGRIAAVLAVAIVFGLYYAALGTGSAALMALDVAVAVAISLQMNRGLLSRALDAAGRMVGR